MKILPKLHQTNSSKRAVTGAVPASPTQQWLKSAQTKKRLIEGAIRCIVKFGYSKTTTSRVASEAGLSRGAMLHHFENGEALMRAVIAELNDKRLRAIRRTGDIASRGVHEVVRAYWYQLSSSSFTAFHELSIAARTDEGLAQILEPAQAEFPLRPFPNGRKTARILILHLRCRSRRLKAWLLTALSMGWTRRWWSHYLSILNGRFGNLSRLLIS